MPVDLSSPLAWKTASGDAAAMLSQLQPNILKGHVREHLRILLIQFSDKAEGRAFLKAVGGKVKSAKKHLDEVEAFTATGTPGTAYVGVGLTFAGYKKLGIATAKIPSNGASSPFVAGMRSDASVNALNDPPVSTWEEPYRHTIHAVVIVGDADKAKMLAKRAVIRQLFTPKVKLLGEETGLGQHNAHGEGIEHFGYVDGRSQPLFLDEDIGRPSRRRSGTRRSRSGRVLVARPGRAQARAALRQLTSSSASSSRTCARSTRPRRTSPTTLGLVGADRKRAGAMMVGRFEDGTPLTAAQQGARRASRCRTTSTTAATRRARKCPFHGAHPQDQPARLGGTGGQRSPTNAHIMARRGQTYGKRTDDPNDDELPLSARPTGGVGLLFMAFNSEHLQASSSSRSSRGRTTRTSRSATRRARAAASTRSSARARGRAGVAADVGQAAVEGRQGRRRRR